MRYKELLKEIDKHTWWSEEAPAVIQTIIYPLHCYLKQSKVFHPKLISFVVVGFKDDFMCERASESEKYAIYKYIFKKMKKDRDFLYKIIKYNLKEIDLFYKEFSYFNKNKDKMNNKQLCNSYTNFMNKYLDYLPYQAGIECVDVFTTYYLEDMVKKEINITVDKLRDIMFILSCPKILSFMEKERIDFLNMCLSHYNDIRKNRLTDNLKKQLDKHSKKYFYVLNSFKVIKYLDRNYFFKKSKEEVRKDKSKLRKEFDSLKNKINNLKEKEKDIYKKYNFSDNLKLHLKITKIMGKSIDERKDNMLKANYYIYLYCKEIAKRFNINTSKVMDYTFEEIRSLLIKGKKADEKLFRKRKKGAVYIIEGKNGNIKTKWFYGKQAETILKRTSVKSKEIKGQVASSPVKKLKGKVQVILDTSKQKFKKGNILVTTMTRPDFVPLMRKAKAIITDEGGITCHAAIVSREMKIPCIIGTKVATKLLKDGDYVEIDTEKGKVKKIR